MGSSGTGHFSDYSGTSKDKSGGGGSSGDDPCRQPFECELEDVARSDYYQQHNSLPAIGAVLALTFDRRIGAKAPGGELVGYVPTEHNRVAGCLRAGWRFPASIVNTTLKPFPRVWVAVTPER